jgi:imidazolonepropionase
VENLAGARTAQEINAAGRVVMPGFVDSHTHLAFPPPGTAGLDLEAAAREIRATNGRRIQRRAHGYLDAMARHGTTTVEVKTGCGPDERAEIKILRALAALQGGPLDLVPTLLVRLPSRGSPGAHEALAAYRKLMATVRRRGLAHFVDFAWESGPDRVAALLRCMDIARELGFPCKVHASEANACAAIRTAIERLAAAVDHLEWATVPEAQSLAGSAAVATLLPYASFQSGGPGVPARALIDAGVPIALATNFNPLLLPCLNMQTVVSLACLRMRMTPAEAVSAATVNGAYAVGRGHLIGSLEPGKQADVIVLDASDYQDLARRFGVNLVHMTIKRGEIVYTEGAVSSGLSGSL